jgi:hypothetical protein
MKFPFRIPTLPSGQIILMVGLFILLPLPATACAARQAVATGLVQMVPPEANLIAEIKLDEALEDADLERLATTYLGNLGGPETLDDLLEEASNKLGLDLRDFSRILIYGDIAQNDDFFAFIVQGAFDLDTLSTAIGKSEGPLTASDHKGHILLIGERGGEVTALALIDNDTAVYGIEAAVKALIDVWSGDKVSASGPVYKAFSNLDDGLFRLALEIPQDDLLDLENFLGDSSVPSPYPWTPSPALRPLEFCWISSSAI